jgi:hypothetical protein
VFFLGKTIQWNAAEYPVIHEWREGRPPRPAMHRSTKITSKVDMTTAPESLGHFGCSVDSGVSAFVVRYRISCEFVFRAQFQVDLMPVVVARVNRPGFFSASRLVCEHVSIAYRETDCPSDSRKIFHMPRSKNPAATLLP